MVEKNEGDVEVTVGSGNVFEDLGFENPTEMKLKAAIASQINSIIRNRHLTQKQAAEILGISQPKVSNLQNGKFFGLSLEKLLELMTRLDRDVEIGFKKVRSRKPAFFVKNEKSRIEVAA